MGATLAGVLEEAAEPMRGKWVGGVLIAVAIGLLLIALLFLGGAFAAGRFVKTGAAGFICWLTPALVLSLVIAAAGVYMLMSGRAEEKELLDVEKEKAVLNIIETRGKARLAEIAIELNLTQDQVKQYIYDLVGKKLFTGYVDWKGGVLQSKEAKDLPQKTCPNCGGELELAGKGTIKCPYCGAETFL